MMYEKMKPSGVSWLGDIPENWDCKKIGSLFSQRKTKVSDKDYAPLSVSKAGVVPQLETAVKTDNGDNRKLVKAGDFVINSRSDRKGSCGVSPLDGSVSLINIVLTPRQEWNNRYVHYLMRSQPFSEEYYHYGRGIVADLWTTRFSEMKNICLPIPSRAEQDQIVRYLDWQVSKINKLIAAKKKELLSLREFRKAYIDNAIFHGVHKNGEEKDSNVYWLGKIPKSWNVLALKRITIVGASVNAIAGTFENEALVPFIPMENVSVIGEVDYSISKPLKDVRTGYSSFAKNDVVVAKITPCFENGKGALLDKMPCEIGYGTTEFINIRSTDKILPKYLYYITSSRTFRILGEEVMTGSAGQKRIPVSYVKNFTCGIPPIEDQQNIIDCIEAQLPKIDNQIDALLNEISFIQELRTKLISDVVTGQIDVRGIEIPEYEYVEEEADEGEEESDEEIEEQEVDEE